MALAFRSELSSSASVHFEEGQPPHIRGRSRIPGLKSSFIPAPVSRMRSALSYRPLPLPRNWRRDLRGVDRCQDVSVKCSATNDAPPPVYKGVYGDWSVEDSDKLEVTAYRTGLITSALSFCLASSPAFLPPSSPLRPPLLASLDLLYTLGSLSLGASLALIHIYVTPIKRTLQGLWAVGVLGSGALALNFAGPAGEGVVAFTVGHGAGVWAVGPVFAALTGLVFKEVWGNGRGGGKRAFGTVDAPIRYFCGQEVHAADQSERGFGLMMGQTEQDDIGDKSVFLFQALPREQQEALIRKLQMNAQEK